MVRNCWNLVRFRLFSICTVVILLPMHFTIIIRVNRLENDRGSDNVVHGVLEQEITTSYLKKKKEFVDNQQCHIVEQTIFLHSMYQ